MDPTPAADLKLNAEQLSSEEFHRGLYGWFEDRGLLSDLRSHLRTKMIHVLKETPIGRSDSRKSMSPKVGFCVEFFVLLIYVWFL